MIRSSVNGPAQSTPLPRLTHDCLLQDLNGDGMLDEEEWLAGRGSQKLFSELDVNVDGKLDVVELAAGSDESTLLV